MPSGLALLGRCAGFARREARRAKGGLLFLRRGLLFSSSGGLLFFDFRGLFITHEHIHVRRLHHEGVGAVEGKSIGFGHLLVVLVELDHERIELGLELLFLGRVGLLVVGRIEVDGLLTLGLDELNVGLKLPIGLDRFERGGEDELLLLFGDRGCRSGVGAAFFAADSANKTPALRRDALRPIIPRVDFFMAVTGIELVALEDWPDRRSDGTKPSKRAISSHRG